MKLTLSVCQSISRNISQTRFYLGFFKTVLGLGVMMRIYAQCGKSRNSLSHFLQKNRESNDFTEEGIKVDFTKYIFCESNFPQFPHCGEDLGNCCTVLND